MIALNFFVIFHNDLLTFNISLDLLKKTKNSCCYLISSNLHKIIYYEQNYGTLNPGFLQKISSKHQQIIKFHCL